MPPPTALRVAFFNTTGAAWTRCRDLYVTTANELLKPHGMVIDSSETPGPKPIALPWPRPNNDDPAVYWTAGHAREVRQMAEEALPGVQGVPVIFTLFPEKHGYGKDLGWTLTTKDDGKGSAWPKYIMLNCRRYDKAGCALLHELIHAAVKPEDKPLPHDDDPLEVFFDNGVSQDFVGPLQERKLSTKYVEKLKLAYFAAPNIRGVE